MSSNLLPEALPKPGSDVSLLRNEKDLLTKLKVELAFSKFEIFSLAQSQPSLDDVYLQATGKTLLDAEISMTGKRDLKKESKQSMR